MATIYRFIVEQKVAKESSGRKGTGASGSAKKGAAKKGKMVSIFGGEKVVSNTIEKCVLSTH